MSTSNPDILAQLRRTAEAGSDEVAWKRYVAALLEAGQKGRARKAARASPLKGSSRKALVAMADTGMPPGGAPLKELVGLIRAGKTPEARALGRGLLKRFPKDAKLLNVLGVMAIGKDDPIEAEVFLRRALDVEPSNSDVISNLGLALVRQGRTTEAISLLEPLAQGKGAPLNARVNLASAYLRAERPEDALDLTVDILKDAPGDPETCAVRAKAHLFLGNGAAALEALKPLQAKPGFDLQDLVADALERSEGRATALKYIQDLGSIPHATGKRLAYLMGEWGEIEAARDRARALAEQDPSDPGAHALVGLFGRWTPGDPLLAHLEQGMENASLSAVQRGTFGLALGKARMDLGQDDAAFEALMKGNNYLRHVVSYDVARDRERFRNIAQIWDAQALEALRDDEPPALAPVFIVGLPRSGSTLIETILSRHPNVTALGESPRAYAAVGATGNQPTIGAIRDIRRRLADVLSSPNPGGVVTDKLLTNFMNVGALSAAFPEARFIEARRDLRAIGLSIFQTELAPTAHPYSLNLEDLANYAVGYARLTDHWARVLGDRFYRADYERLVSDPGSEIPKLVAAAGLTWDEACLGREAPKRRINSYSVAQARAPITTKSVARWTRYETGLKPLIDILQKEGLIAD